MKFALPNFAARVSRRDIALSPAVWVIVWGTFAMFALGTAAIAVVGVDGLEPARLGLLSAGLGLAAVVMARMPPPEPDTARTHALIALTYVAPMAAIFAFAPQGSAVAITTAFAGPLSAVWIVDRRQIAAHQAAATLTLFLPSLCGAVDDATLVACIYIAPTMWALALTCVVVLEGAEQQGAELTYLGKRDPLTGAGNRRLLEEELAHELTHYHQARRPFALLTFDLNGFKALNDTVGHAAGDRLLQATADVLARTARTHDTVARQGGDEFCLLLPGTSERDARVLGELIRARLQAVRAYGSGISTGIGVAACPKDGTTASTLLAAADARLLADKADGPRRDGTSWRDEVPELAPRPEVEAEAESESQADPVVEKVGRQHLEGLGATWAAASAVTLFYALVGAGVLLWAPHLAGTGLETIVGITAFVSIAMRFVSPPRIGTRFNHLYVTVPYVLPVAFGLTMHPSSVTLALSMFVGPLAAARLLDRREIAAHLALASVLFAAVAAVHHDELSTVIATVIVIGNLWVLGLCCVFVLEASETQGREVADVVRRDPLTGLGNRRRLRERLAEDLAEHAASARPLTLIALDLNGFKQLNDTIGHAAGDAVLQRVADALRVVAAPPAEAMRQGGDEFIVLLPDTTADEARAAMAAIGRTLGTLDEQGVPVSTGLGAASFPVDGTTADALLDAADHRLRADKYGHADAEPPRLRARRSDDLPVDALD